jgi:hypothetical protein
MYQKKVRYYLALSPFHTQAIQRLQDFADQDMEMWISRQTLREYLSGMTERMIILSSLTSNCTKYIYTYLSRFSNIRMGVFFH